MFIYVHFFRHAKPEVGFALFILQNEEVGLGVNMV